MADINFDCPHCGHNLEVSERGAGLTVACPECAKSIVVPIPAPEPVVSDFIFNCGSCGHPLKVSSDMAGQLVDCPVCKKPTVIPWVSRPTPPTPAHPAARSTPIPKPPSQRQVPGTGTSNPSAPAATRPPKASSPGLVIAVISLALVCAGLTAGMFFVIKNRNGVSTTDQGTPVAPTKENAGLARRTGKKEALAEKALPDVTVDGEVFVVTKGGQSIKLGLVEVVLIPMETLMPYLVMRYTTLANELPGAVQELKKAIEEKDRLSKASDVAEKNYRDAYGQARQELFVAYTNALQSSIIAMENMLEPQHHYSKLTSESFYFDSMPSPLRVTKTNSDGRFRLLTPGSGSFAVAAIASRHVGDDVERYYWLLKIDPRAGANQTIMLSNDNLMTSDGVEVFIQTNR